MSQTVAKVFMPGALVVLAAAAWPQVQTTPQENLIHVEVGGLRSAKGQVRCGLFSSAVDFPSKNAIAKATSSITGGQAVCEFRGVAPGTLAVSVFHDENSNGKLDTNFIGIPREGVGASNNAKGRFGPPKFRDASIEFSGGRMDIKIAITYL